MLSRKDNAHMKNLGHRRNKEVPDDDLANGGAEPDCHQADIRAMRLSQANSHSKLSRWNGKPVIKHDCAR